MPEVAECLNRRYRALDELINELSALHGSGEKSLFTRPSYDPGIKLMCDFWNILKEDPDCDLSHAVKQRMGVPVQSNQSMFHQNIACYMAGNDRTTGSGPGRGGSGRNNDPRRDIKRIREICCGTNSFTRNANARDCRVACPAPGTDIRKPDSSMPLSKALCNLKEAASFDKKCNVRITALMETQRELKSQVQNLEQRERDGIQLLREADSMWSSMEEEYKNKIALSIERQRTLLKQLKEVEVSHTKWRRNKKQLEDELKHAMKSKQEMSEKVKQKNNDIKCIELEIADFTRRIYTNKRTADGSKQALAYKKTTSDKKVNKYNEDMKKLKETLAEVQKHKRDKEAEGKQYVQEAREDLQDICKVLMQKKLENEDLVAEKEAVLQEIDLLKETCDQCKSKCDKKRNTIEEEIKNIDKCIADYKYQCVQCHQCTDTSEARRLCSDCPKCKEQRECITAGDHCDRDTSFDCICVVVKEKFLNNVFDNMNTVLERQTKTKAGKMLADKIVKCLKNSRNGKLNCETRDTVKTFVLNTVKKNLNLTIVGGAVKTRCELDADSYKQLMHCLQLVKADKPLKEDKGTVVKKQSCARWGATSECNCPGGPAYCVCARKAPPPPKEPTPCPDTPKDKGPTDPGAVLCPHKETVSCGPECAMIPPPPKSEAIIPTKATKLCSTSGCPFAKNMRAAQCVLGPESLNSLPKAHTQSTPIVSPPIVSGATSVLEKTISKSDIVAKNSGKSRKDAKQLKADSICDCNESNRLQKSRGGSPIKNKNNLTNVSVSNQASGKLADFFDYGDQGKHYFPNSCLKQKETKANKSVIVDKITQSNNTSIPVTSENIGNDDLDLNKMLNDLVEKSAKKSEDLQFFSVKDKVTEISNQDTLIEPESAIESITSNISKTPKTNASPISIIHQSILMLSNLQQKYENKESIDIKLETETGLYTIRSPVTKTISGNLAMNVKILRGKLNFKDRDKPIVIRRSDSGAIILDQNVENFSNAVIRKTISGAILLVVPNSFNDIKQTAKPVKSNEAPIQLYKVKIESDDFDTTLPLAVLKSTPSQNLLLVPDKEFENTYNKKVQQVLEEKTEYYVNLTKVDSKNCVLRVDDSWAEHKPNAVIIKSDSGNIKIVDKNSVSFQEPEQKRSSIISSSKILGEIIGTTPRKTNTESRRLIVIPKSPMLQKKSSSDTNLYDKVRLIYSSEKDLLKDPPAILKMTKSGQYAVILGKESKATFMKHLRKYLKNNAQGLVPIKKTDTGEITISLNDDHSNKCNNYGSLKITTSGNMFVIVDKEIVKGMEVHDASMSSSVDSLNEVASRHIIGKLRYPVNKAIGTTCSARPGVECDGSQCACADLQTPKLNWIYNRRYDTLVNFVESKISGLVWKKAVNKSPKTVNKYNNNRFTESENSLGGIEEPRIVIKPCVSVLGSGENVNHVSGSWDSLSYLPTQLPEFLRHYKYR